MKSQMLAAMLLGMGFLSGCGAEPPHEPPVVPAAITADAVGQYCGMNLSDHPGPKGQVHLRSRGTPVWLTSVRDTFAFLMLPDEPKNVRAAFVSDMGGTTGPDKADPTRWVAVQEAWYVAGAEAPAAMTGAELYPFSKEADARDFIHVYGGQLRRFADIRPDDVLGGDMETSSISQGGSDAR
ncbi:nitrous oxide reductase accessory protein NosL [Niveispirillum fermenti]|uniref:nitrous oxide reductase accessory protein NosL n=1 Tax=Niveispirillum fermenti TaxID=1233113 RepID=UPI003A87F717